MVDNEVVARHLNDLDDCLQAIDAIPTELAERVRSLAGFRNVIIHDYVDVDLDRVAGFVNDRLDDLRDLARHINRAAQE